jgi:hypothetical protein
MALYKFCPNKISKINSLQFLPFSTSKSLYTKSSVTFISKSIQNFMWFINRSCKIEEKNFDFVQWACFWITQKVTLLNLIFFNVLLPHHILQMQSHNAGTTHGTKLYITKVGGVLQQHDACNPSYSLCHTYISMKVS